MTELGDTGNTTTTTGGQTTTTTNPGATGGATTSWRDSLPEDIRGDSSLAMFSDVGSLAKSYISTKSMVGKKGVVVPGEKATEEEWTAFHRAIGLPEKEKYEISLPKDKKLNNELVGKFKEIAHKSGVLPRQAQALLDWYLKDQEESGVTHEQTISRQRKEGIEALKKEWGQGYEEQVLKGRAAVSAVGEEFGQFLEESKLGDDPRFIRAFAKLGAFLGNDKLRGESGGRMGSTPAEIQNEINKVMGDPKHPYFNPSHPGHLNAVSQMTDYYKQMAQGG